MRKKSNMTWRTSICLSTFITLVFVIPLCSPHYLELMGEEVFGFVDSVPKYISTLYSAGVLFTLTFLLFQFNFRVLKEPLTLAKRNILVIPGTLLATFLYSTLQLGLHICLFTPREAICFTSPMALGLLFNNISTAILVIFISHIIYLSEKRQQMALQYETLKMENMQIRYEALKSQLNPHFLFNTMSILDSLVDEDRQKTHEYIQRFSSVYRYILQKREVVTLGEELDFIDNYFGLLQVRFGESLVLVLEIAPAYNHYSIVPLGLQTLMENAVQHNIISRKRPLYVTISTTPEGELTVSNNLQPKPMATAGAGIGLANLAERYQLKWRKDIAIEQTEDTFKVTLPLVNEPPKTV